MAGKPTARFSNQASDGWQRTSFLAAGCCASDSLADLNLPERGRAGVAVAVEPMGANDDISLARFLVASRSARLIGRGGWRNALRYECGSAPASCWPVACKAEVAPLLVEYSGSSLMVLGISMLGLGAPAYRVVRRTGVSGGYAGTVIN